MATESPSGNRSRTPPEARGRVWRDRAAALLVAGLATAAMLVVYRSYEPFELDPDEGIELMKARLVDRGFALYDEVWSDQPPLATHVLRAWLRVFGWSADAGRVLVLLTAGLLLGSLYHVVQRSWGHAHGLGAVVLLLLCGQFVPRSVSVMFIIPMHAFIVLAVCLLWGSPRSGRWLPVALSAIAMAVAVQIKLAAVIVAPLLAIWAFGAGRAGGTGSRRWLGPAVWTGTLAAVTAGLTVGVVGLGNLRALIAPHVGEELAAAFRPGGPILHHMIGDDWQFALLAIAGAGFVVLRRSWRSLLPLAWYALGYVVLLNHRPLWVHYYLFLAIPTAWLGGVALGELAKWSRAAWVPGTSRDQAAGALLRWVSLALVALAAFGIPAKITRLRQALDYPATRHDQEVLASMIRYAPHTRWVVTDRQMLPFRADLPVPPELSVTSLKRIHSGNLKPKDVLDVLRRYEPEQVYFGGKRVPMTPALRAHLMRNYRPRAPGYFVTPRVLELGHR